MNTTPENRKLRAWSVLVLLISMGVDTVIAMLVVQEKRSEESPDTMRDNDA